MYIWCNPLTVYLTLQVKNKPNGGIAFPAFIFGSGVIMNKTDFCMAFLQWTVNMKIWEYKYCNREWEFSKDKTFRPITTGKSVVFMRKRK